MDSYEDIINIKHFDPKNHKRMSMGKRAAQFAPFAALTGYDDALSETGRITDSMIYLDDSVKEEISDKLNMLLKDKKRAEITYFIKDLKKEGGSYKKVISSIKKIDNVNRYIYLDDKSKVLIDDIIDICLDVIDV